MKKKRLLRGLTVVLLTEACSQEEMIDSSVYSHVLIEPMSTLSEGVVIPLSDSTATRAVTDGTTQALTFYFLRANETGVGTNTYGSYNATVLPATRAKGAGAQPLTFTPSIAYLASGIGTEAWAVQYPGVYISARDPYSWLTTQNGALWGTPWVAGGVNLYNDNQGVKSIYDPCPVGYRVPPMDAWSLQTTKGTFVENGVILDKVAIKFLASPFVVCRNRLKLKKIG